MWSPIPPLIGMGSRDLVCARLHGCLHEMSPCIHLHGRKHGLHQGRLSSAIEGWVVELVCVEGSWDELPKSHHWEKSCYKKRSGDSCASKRRFHSWRPCHSLDTLQRTWGWWEVRKFPTVLPFNVQCSIHSTMDTHTVNNLKSLLPLIEKMNILLPVRLFMSSSVPI